MVRTKWDDLIKGWEERFQRVCEHVEDDIDLPMADLSDILKSDRPNEELIRDPKVIDALEEAVMGWERHIVKVIDSYLAKVSKYYGLSSPIYSK